MQKKMKVALEGMKFHAFHGFYEEEAIIGNHFLLDVLVETDFSDASQSDNLVETVNYESIYNVCTEVMTQRFKLLEKIAEMICSKLKALYPNIQLITVKVRKLNPPFGGDVASALIELTHNYSI
ncbi:MAG: dihydroneopterin aldolase [Saprospiraceae bacterium]